MFVRAIYLRCDQNVTVIFEFCILELSDSETSFCDVVPGCDIPLSLQTYWMCSLDLTGT